MASGVQAWSAYSESRVRTRCLFSPGSGLGSLDMGVGTWFCSPDLGVWSSDLNPHMEFRLQSTHGVQTWESGLGSPDVKSRLGVET